MWTAQFWRQVAERAVKTFAQSVVAGLGVGWIGIVEVPWGALLDAGGLAALLSVLTSVVSGTVDNESVPTASLVSIKPAGTPPQS